MAIKSIFNPLLEEGFQKINDISFESHVQTGTTVGGVLLILLGAKALVVNSVLSFITRITAIQSATAGAGVVGDVFVHEYRGAIKRVGAGASVIVDTITDELLAEDIGTALYTVAIGGSVGGELSIKVTGEPNKTIQWKAETIFSEITY